MSLNLLCSSASCVATMKWFSFLSPMYKENSNSCTYIACYEWHMTALALKPLCMDYSVISCTVVILCSYNIFNPFLTIMTL